MSDFERTAGRGGGGRDSLLRAQAASLLEGETDLIADLANLSALLNLTLPDINWVGFYLLRGNDLVLGPFQGKPACVRIPLGRGVCGRAAERDETQIVPDVRAFSGHIACDGDSRSEIVVPLHSGGRVAGVLDVDSPLPARFDETDAGELEGIAGLLETACL